MNYYYKYNHNLVTKMGDCTQTGSSKLYKLVNGIRDTRHFKGQSSDISSPKENGHVDENKNRQSDQSLDADESDSKQHRDVTSSSSRGESVHLGSDKVGCVESGELMEMDITNVLDEAIQQEEEEEEKRRRDHRQQDGDDVSNEPNTVGKSVDESSKDTAEGENLNEIPQKHHHKPASTHLNQTHHVSPTA